MMLRACFLAFLVKGKAFSLFSAEVEQVPVDIPGKSSLVSKDQMNESGKKLGTIIDVIGASLSAAPVSWMNEPA